VTGAIVVKVGGSVLDEIAHMPGLWDAIGAVHAFRRDEGLGGLIVCHGGGRAVDAHLAALGHETVKIDGVRATPPEQVDAVVGVLGGVVNTRLVAALREHGAQAVGVTLADAGTVVVADEDRLGPGLGCVGRVVSGDGSLFETLLDGGFLPVVASIGMAEDGRLMNVNADEAAEGVAASVDAEMLVMLTDVAGVLDADGDLIEMISADDALSLIESGVVAGGMAAKVRAASGAAMRLGRAVLIGSVGDAADLISGRIGVGTRIEPMRVRTEPTGTIPVGDAH
jgi:acetylglutamate kinase